MHGFSLATYVFVHASYIINAPPINMIARHKINCLLEKGFDEYPINYPPDFLSSAIIFSVSEDGTKLVGPLPSIRISAIVSSHFLASAQ